MESAISVKTAEVWLRTTYQIEVEQSIWISKIIKLSDIQTQKLNIITKKYDLAKFISQELHLTRDFLHEIFITSDLSQELPQIENMSLQFLDNTTPNSSFGSLPWMTIKEEDSNDQFNKLQRNVKHEEEPWIVDVRVIQLNQNDQNVVGTEIKMSDQQTLELKVDKPLVQHNDQTQTQSSNQQVISENLKIFDGSNFVNLTRLKSLPITKDTSQKQNNALVSSSYMIKVQECQPQQNKLDQDSNLDKSKSNKTSEANQMSQVSSTVEISIKNTTLLPTDSQLSYEIDRRISLFMRKMKHVKNDTKIKHSSFLSFSAIPGYEKNDQLRDLHEKIQREEEKNLISEVASKPEYVDMVFLYSNPLVKKPTSRIQPKYFPVEDQALNTEEEYRKIRDVIKKHSIEFSFIKYNATQSNLYQIITNQTKILHITCHGDYNGSQDNKEVSKLIFEDSTAIGVQDNLTVDIIQQLLTNVESSGIRLVLVSACHSEQIGEIIKEKLHNAIVIAISKATPVLDQSATMFAEEFYDLILQGFTPDRAFKLAKSAVRGNACCCQHNKVHKKDCFWKQSYDKTILKYQETQSEPLTKNQVIMFESLARCDACQVHDPNAICEHQNLGLHEKYQIKDQIFSKSPACTCQENLKARNMHDDMCPFYEHFYQKYQLLSERPHKTPNNVCCCSQDDIPHNESEKFLIISGKTAEQKLLDEKNLNEALYPQFSPGEMIDLQGVFSSIKNKKTYSNLKKVNKSDPLILLTRNKQIFDVIRFLVNDESKKVQKVCKISGDRDNGKNEITIFATQYCFDRSRIQAVLYFDFNHEKSQPLNWRDFLDALNVQLELEINVNTLKDKDKYCKQIIEKIQKKLDHAFPFTLLIDNLIFGNQVAQEVLDLLEQFLEKLTNFRLVMIEDSTPKEWNKYGVENIQIKDMDLNEKKKVLRTLFEQREIFYENYLKSDFMDKKLNHELKHYKHLVSIVDKIKQVIDEGTIDQSDTNLILERAFYEYNDYQRVQLQHLSSITSSSQYSPFRYSESQSQMPQFKEYYRSNRCVTCLKKLIELEEEEDENSNNSDQKVAHHRSQELPQINWDSLNLAINNDFIRNYRLINPFLYREDIYLPKFLKKSENKYSQNFEFREMDQADGIYYGEVSQGKRIANRRGIFIQNINGNLYEGWRINNKRELYGRLICADGTIYQGQYKNNFPHGLGKILSKPIGPDSYPVEFEFYGKFKEGKKVNYGIMKMPGDKKMYYGQYHDNMMHDTFTINNEEGDCLLEGYDEDRKLETFRKIEAYLIRDDINESKQTSFFAFVPYFEYTQPERMPKNAFRSLQNYDYFKNLTLIYVDIEDKKDNMLLRSQFINTWLKYQAQDKSNVFIYEILLGKFKSFEVFLNSNTLAQLRKNFDIKVQNSETKKQVFMQYYLKLQQQEKSIINQTVTVIQVDEYFKNVLHKTMITLQDYLDQIRDPLSKWDTILKMQDITLYQEQREEILKNLCDSSQEFGLQAIPSYESPSVEQAQRMLNQIKQCEEKSLPIKQFVNISRLVDSIINGKNYETQSYEDVIHSLTFGSQYFSDKTLNSNIISLGESLMETCLSMHFFIQGLDIKMNLETYMSTNKICELYEKSGLLKISLQQTQFQKPIDAPIDLDDDLALAYLNLKHLQHDLLSREPSQDLKIDPPPAHIAKLLGLTEAQTFQDIKIELITRALSKLEQEMNQKEMVEVTQEMKIVKGLDKESMRGVFMRFMGTMVHLKESTGQCIEAVMKMIKECLPQERTEKAEGNKKLKSLYKMRRLHELESHLGYTFKDNAILVQSLILKDYPSEQNQIQIELVGKYTLKFVMLREAILKIRDKDSIQSIFKTVNDIHNTNIIKQSNISVLATLLQLHSKIYYDKESQPNNNKNEFFQDYILEVETEFQLKNQPENVDSVDVLNKFKSKSRKLTDIQKVLNPTFYAIIGALSQDSKFDDKIYNTFCTLIPFIVNWADPIFINDPASQGTDHFSVLKQPQLTALENSERLHLAELFKASNNALRQTTSQIRDCFDCPGKLMKAHEFNLGHQESYDRMVDYVRNLEEQGKHKLINIVFSDDQQNEPSYVETQYYIIHSHIISVCLNLEEHSQRKGLVTSFIEKMRGSNKQRVINESQIMMTIKDKQKGPQKEEGISDSLTLAQKIKMLINLNSVQYQTQLDKILDLYNSPTHDEAMVFVNNLQIQKEKTFDSMIYIYTLTNVNQPGINPLGTTKDQDHHFIKQPLLQAQDGETESQAIFKKNERYIKNNILENQLIQLSHFLNNQESTKQNELIIFDEEQIRILDYMALRQDTGNMKDNQCPIQLLSLILQMIATSTQNLHQFDVFHGNNKPERIKLHPSGADGFFYNGNFLILFRDEVVQKRKQMLAAEDPDKNISPPMSKLYLPDKQSSGYASKILSNSIKQQVKISKVELYMEEAYQISMNADLLFFKKKITELMSAQQIQAFKMIENIVKIAKKAKYSFSSLYDFQNNIGNDWSFAVDSIMTFRASLHPTYSRNLWVSQDQMTPLSPDLQRLVFPWKHFNSQQPVDYSQCLEIENNDFTQNIMGSLQQQMNMMTDDQTQNTKDIKLSQLRTLHLMFIEDWWYEIASLMSKDIQTYDQIDEQVLEYVKNMRIGGMRVKLDWLRLNVELIKYFKARQQEAIRQEANVHQIEEESKESGSPRDDQYGAERRLEDIRSRIKAFAGDTELSNTNSTDSNQSFTTDYDEDLQEQDQLRHFIRAGIYPLKVIHTKIYIDYGRECLKDYLQLIFDALDLVTSLRFKAQMGIVFGMIAADSKVIKEMRESFSDQV